MKTTSFIILILWAFMITANAQKTTVYNQKGYKLIFINYDATFDTLEQQRLVKTFFTVYPELVKTYNKHALKEVTMVIDTAYTGVAATANGRVTISNKWLHKRPEDIDVVTHEVMHIVQDYGDSNGPGWLTEGIADYARYKFGVNNAAAGWKLPDYKPTQNYDNAYRVTARFLVWLEEKVKPGIVKTLDEQMRAHTFTDATWTQLTGKSVDQLWKDYSANPAI
jgi:hypothetical protein